MGNQALQRRASANCKPRTTVLGASPQAIVQPLRRSWRACPGREISGWPVGPRRLDCRRVVYQLCWIWILPRSCEGCFRSTHKTPSEARAIRAFDKTDQAAHARFSNIGILPPRPTAECLTDIVINAKRGETEFVDGALLGMRTPQQAHFVNQTSVFPRFVP
jgi:hypothetical protein